ncbi:DUF4190 domain-containing protein [Paenarthrobacter sp. NPDC092416]|uniref:DUF4190 domain-containing protein n=1 Tax=Paenarthrobacter sp. NPDC092416 TaxID=3364386 RepID=UPI00382B8F0C
MSDQPSKGNEDKPAGYEPPHYVPPAEFSAPEQGAPVPPPPFEPPTSTFEQPPSLDQTAHFDKSGSQDQPGTFQTGAYPQDPYYTQPLPPYDRSASQGQQQPYGQPSQPAQSAPSSSYGQSGSYGQPTNPYGQPPVQPPSPYQQQPYGQPNPYGQPAYYGMPAQPKGLSIAAMICGIAIYIGFGFIILPQIAAVILGHLGLNREPAGRGMAIAGLIMGYVGLAITVVVLIVFFAAIGASTSRFSY